MRISSLKVIFEKNHDLRPTSCFIELSKLQLAKVGAFLRQSVA